MQVIDGKDITISRGDTLDVIFRVSGLSFTDGDKAIFSIKSDYVLKPIYTCECTLRGNVVGVLVPADVMAKIDVGEYKYDIVVTIVATGKVITLFATSFFTVEEVAHNVG